MRAHFIKRGMTGSKHTDACFSIGVNIAWQGTGVKQCGLHYMRLLTKANHADGNGFDRFLCLVSFAGIMLILICAKVIDTKKEIL